MRADESKRCAEKVCRIRDSLGSVHHRHWTLRVVRSQPTTTPEQPALTTAQRQGREDCLIAWPTVERSSSSQRRETVVERLPNGTIVHDEIRGKVFKIRSYLGGGGFGKAFRAIEMAGHRERPGTETCLKFTLDSDMWHGEVYFGGLLKGQSHVVRMNAAFTTTIHQRGRPRTAFVIDMELIDGGTVRAHFDADNEPWTEAQVRFRIKQLLKPLSLLHVMGVSHRDITPPNVFVGNRMMLKLGDFGITKAQLKPAGTEPDFYHPLFKPRDLGSWWNPRDDVFQVGLLMATLLAGEEVYGGDYFLGVPYITQITSRGPFRDAVKDCLRVRAQRIATAGDLLARLK